MIAATSVQDVMPDNNAIADGGSYFTASLAPGAAALAFGVVAAFSATAPAFVIQNTDTAAGKNRNLHMKYLRFEASVAPASGTQAWLASVIDTGARTPSAGMAPLTPVCVNSGALAATAGANVWTFTGGAAITVPAAVAASTVVGNLLLRPQIPVAGDEYAIQFGGVDMPAGYGVTAAPAGAGSIVKGHPPIVLAPQHFALFYLWFPNNSVTGLSIGSFDCGFTMK